MSRNAALGCLRSFSLTGSGGPASADVITDWNEKAIALVDEAPHAAAAGGAGHRQRPRGDVRCGQLDRPPLPALSACRSPPPRMTSKEAAAAVAAGMVLAGLLSRGGRGIERSDDSLSGNDARRRGQVGWHQSRARRRRAKSSRNASETARMRPMPTGRRRSPVVYVPTPITASSMWPNVKPFAMTSPSQFRPQPPIALTSEGMGGRLQRNQGARRQEQHQADAKADRGCDASG